MPSPWSLCFDGWTPFRRWLANAQQNKGGCVIGNLSTTLSDCHNGFRKRLAECFDEMAQEFVPHLKQAARRLPRQASSETRGNGPLHRDRD